MEVDKETNAEEIGINIIVSDGESGDLESIKASNLVPALTLKIKST
jgi:hypothetical protein